MFLARIKENDRDCVKYVDFKGFECDHYFGGLHIYGSCFYGFEKEFKDIIYNDFDKIETILTQNEFKKLFELNDKIKDLGYGIKKETDERYKKGLEILKEFNDTLKVKLESEENKKLFKKIQEDEKNIVCKNII